MKICHIVIIAIVLIFGAVSCSPAKKKTNTELLNEAMAYADRADWRKALKLIQQAVEQDPRDAGAQLFCALALENAASLSEALDKAKQAADLAPDNFFAQYTLGRLYFRIGSYDRAVAPLMRALKLRPGDPNTTLLLAQAGARRNIGMALKFYGDLTKMKDYSAQSALWNEMGVLSLADKKQDKAYQYFKQAEKLSPNNHITALNLAVLYDFYLHNKREAITYYRKFLRQTQTRSDLDAKRVEVNMRLREIEN